MKKVSIMLWMDNKAGEAAEFYSSFIPNTTTKSITRYPDSTPDELKPKGTDVMTAEISIDGIDCVLLNGGPSFKQTEAFSFVISVDSQEEVDKYWNALIADGGEESQCGWCKDKFGVSWQVTPKQLQQMMGDPDRKKANAVMNCMLQQKKIIISELQKAYDEA